MKKYWILILILSVVGVVVYFGMNGRPQGVPVQKSDDVVASLVPDSIVKNKVAFMADIHNDMDSLDKALKQAKLDGVEAVFVAGDLTINGSRDELVHVLAHLGESGLRYYAVPGNHDLYKNLWGGVFGKEYQSVKMSNAKFILINNGSWRGLGVDQKTWIENEVKECVVIKCVAVMHMPIENNFSKHVMGENSEKVTAEGVWLKQVLLNNNVKTGYSGHLHYRSDYTIDGWETVLVGAISKDRNTETPRFTETEIDSLGGVVNKAIVL